jgi:hypothetical protein
MVVMTLWASAPLNLPISEMVRMKMAGQLDYMVRLKIQLIKDCGIITFIRISMKFGILEINLEFTTIRMTIQLLHLETINN